MRESLSTLNLIYIQRLNNIFIFTGKVSMEISYQLGLLVLVFLLLIAMSYLKAFFSQEK